MDDNHIKQLEAKIAETLGVIENSRYWPGSRSEKNETISFLNSLLREIDAKIKKRKTIEINPGSGPNPLSSSDEKEAEKMITNFLKFEIVEEADTEDQLRRFLKASESQVANLEKMTAGMTGSDAKDTAKLMSNITYTIVADAKHALKKIKDMLDKHKNNIKEMEAFENKIISTFQRPDADIIRSAFNGYKEEVRKEWASAVEGPISWLQTLIDLMPGYLRIIERIKNDQSTTTTFGATIAKFKSESETELKKIKIVMTSIKLALGKQRGTLDDATKTMENVVKTIIPTAHMNSRKNKLGTFVIRDANGAPAAVPLEGLVDVLKSNMGEMVFRTHFNDKKNDFATWVAMADADLGRAVEKIKEKNELTKIFEQYIHNHYRLA